MSLVLGSTMATASASNGLMARLHKGGDAGINHQAEMTAIENGDYEAWKSAIESNARHGALQAINKDNFARYAEAVRLDMSGDKEAARTILEELGIKFPARSGEAGCDRKISETDQAALLESYKSGDYEAWKGLMEQRGGGKVLEFVNADNFSRFAQAKLLQSEGKKREAKIILDELGFPFKERIAKRGRGGAPVFLHN